MLKEYTGPLATSIILFLRSSCSLPHIPNLLKICKIIDPLWTLVQPKPLGTEPKGVHHWHHWHFQILRWVHEQTHVFSATYIPTVMRVFQGKWEYPMILTPCVKGWNTLTLFPASDGRESRSFIRWDNLCSMEPWSPQVVCWRRWNGPTSGEYTVQVSLVLLNLF